MLVPFQWLKEFIDITDHAQEVARRLTMAGLEVDALVKHMDGDIVMEVNVTPNRPDCLSIIGIARELSAIYKIPYRFPEHSVAASAGELGLNVDILDTNLCHRYAGRVIRGLKVEARRTPEWMQNRLQRCGIRSINNVVDATNYVLLELGHPLHAFDLQRLKGSNIRVGTPEGIKGQWAMASIETLDGVEREISGDDLLIWDAEDPVAIAGVMGGLDTEVNNSTVDIFIESAHFHPPSIRRTSKRLGLKTESSYRFERGTDIKMLKKALDRATFLIREMAGGVICGKVDIYPKNYRPAEIEVRCEKINKLLGLALSSQEIVSCLKGLGFEIKDAPDKLSDRLIIKTPAYRRDVEREADVIEEVARIYGYDKISASLPMATLSIDKQKEGDKRRSVKDEISGSLLKSGFTEAINYSFMGIQDIDLLGIGADDSRRAGLIQIMNPLRVEDSFMKTTIIPSLIKNLVHNVLHGSRELRLFEISKVFISNGSSRLPEEREHVAAIYYKERVKSLYRDDTDDFYIVKGVAEAVFNNLKIYDYSFRRSSEAYLHPGRSADIFIGNDKIGYLGAISPAVLGSLNIKRHKASPVVVEIDIESVISSITEEIKYKPMPRFPCIERDTAIVVDSSLESSIVIKWLKLYPSELIEDVYIFDLYYGKNIPEGKKGIAFNVRYRASDRTLRDDEIDELHSLLVDYVIGKTGGELRQ
ncbi:phenylalanine--tRNA ligase subunit beta [Thermodesulfovibrionales bacterium]|nr:phenylalanine--tRNA ligase subunit beta [Thermodesulfovibrionales bacterium]